MSCAAQPPAACTAVVAPRRAGDDRRFPLVDAMGEGADGTAVCWRAMPA